MTATRAAPLSTALEPPRDGDVDTRVAWPAVTGSVRKLGRDQPTHVCGHLLRLSHQDRRMRFCGHVSDDFIHRYARAPHAHVPLRMGYFDDDHLRGCAELFQASRTGFARRAVMRRVHACHTRHGARAGDLDGPGEGPARGV